MTNLAKLLAERESPDRWLVWAPFDAPARTISYAEFIDRVRRLAGELARRGVQPGDRVLLQAENCPEFLVAYFACAWTGAICAVSHPKASSAEIAYFAALTGAVGAITQPAFEPLFADIGLGWLMRTDARLDAPPLAGRSPDPSAPLSLLFTSGTTSRPKAVLWTHANALFAARACAAQLGLRADDLFHVCLPIYHVAGLAWSVFAALSAGAAVLLQPRFSASRYWPAALEHRATLAAHVQFSSGVLAKQPVPERHNYRLWANSTWRPELETHFRVPIAGWYGMTELVSPAIFGDRAQQPGSIGRAAPGRELAIVDGELRVAGERGVTLFAGYFADERATADAFDAAGRFRTGDRVRINDDGSMTFLERAKDVIKTGGENVSAAEVERVAKSIDGVTDAALVGRPDPAYGEIGVLFVVGNVAAERVLERCRAELAPFKVPREVRFLDALPRATLEKIAKGELRRMAVDPSCDT